MYVISIHMLSSIKCIYLCTQTPSDREPYPEIYLLLKYPTGYPKDHSFLTKILFKWGKFGGQQDWLFGSTISRLKIKCIIYQEYTC